MMNAEPDHTITFQDVAEDDLQEVLRLNEASVPAVNSIDLEQMRWFAANAAYFKVAMRGAEIAGFLIGMRPGKDYASPNYQWFSRAYEDFGYIDRVAVAESARRLGLATRMYRDFDASLPPSVGVLTCEVNLVPPNESSMRFHEGFGFRTVGTQTVEQGGKTVALMAKSRKP